MPHGMIVGFYLPTQKNACRTYNATIHWHVPSMWGWILFTHSEKCNNPNWYWSSGCVYRSRLASVGCCTRSPTCGCSEWVNKIQPFILASNINFYLPTQNNRKWDFWCNNPHWRVDYDKRSPKINVWAAVSTKGLSDNCIIGLCDKCIMCTSHMV